MAAMMKKVLPAFVALMLVSCGGGGAKPADDASKKPDAVAASDVHACSEKDAVHKYDLHDEDGDEALVPCAGEGKHDYSGIVHIETLPEGVKITIRATDDDVNEGVLGSDVKQRDAVIVYPKGPGSKAIEVPLKKNDKGYVGEKVVPWDELDKLSDDGTKSTSRSSITTTARSNPKRCTSPSRSASARAVRKFATRTSRRSTWARKARLTSRRINSARP